MIRSSPGLWRSWIRRAKQTALLVERWQAEIQTFLGLLLRFLLSLGATNPLTHAADENSDEVCAVCCQQFRGLREWSHHAFKRHGRIRQVRRLASGTQCSVCLRQFASNSRLCNHIQHSKRCFAALVNAGVDVAPQPGKGSRHFDSGLDVLVPASQAHGPSNVWQDSSVAPEPEQPSDSVLDGLTECLCFESGHVHSLSQLLVRFKEIFSCECLQISRLRATARVWHSRLKVLLDDDDDWPITWATWHRRAADFLLEADYVHWLGGDAVPSRPQYSTFRDAAVTLPWLDFACVGLPDVDTVMPEFSRVPTADAQSCRPFQVDQFIPLSTCKAEPGRLDFPGWARAPFSGGVSLFSVVGLLGSFAVPRPASSFAAIETALQSVRLFGDIVQGTALLWSKGHPAVLIAPALDCPGLRSVQALATNVERGEGTIVLANFALASVFPSCFTCSN